MPSSRRAFASPRTFGESIAASGGPSVEDKANAIVLYARGLLERDREIRRPSLVCPWLAGPT